MTAPLGRSAETEQSRVPRAATASVVAVTTIAAVLCLASSCLAAPPIRGGRYAGKTSVPSRLEGYRNTFIAFNVGDQGRAFVSDPHLVFQGSEIDAPCAGRPWDLGGSTRLDASRTYYTLTDGNPVRIGRDGSFSLAARASSGETPTSLTLTGRFTGQRAATGRFRVASAPPNRARCVRRGSFSVRFTGQRHLTVAPCPANDRLATDEHTVVYWDDYPYDPLVGRGDVGGVIYSCDRTTGQRWYLAGDDHGLALWDFYGCSEWGVGGEFYKEMGVALAGNLVALGVNGGCQAGVGSEIRLVDLTSGDVRLKNRAAAFRRFSGPDGGRVSAVVLDPTGSAAWIVCSAIDGPRGCQVVDEVRSGPNELLDDSPQIDPYSLALDGSTLSWRNNGETKATTLA